MRIIPALSLFILLAAPPLHAAEPQWIWSAAERKPGEALCLSTQITIGKQLRRAECIGVADYCHGIVYVNGKPVARQEPYGPMLKLDLAEVLREGKNTFGFCCRSVTGPAAVMARIELEYADGMLETIVTGKDWLVTAIDSKTKLDWPAAGKIAGRNVVELGRVVAHRWGLTADSIAINPTDDYTQWKRAVAGSSGTDPKTFQVAPGFTVELIRSAAKDEDSWISLAQDARGRWIIGMEKQGLLRLTLPATGQGEVRVERINETLRECRGLVIAHDALYAMANVDSALYRLRDTDGDDRFDKVEKLLETAGDSGHGRNQLTLGPDGELWAIFGDSIFEPESAKKLPPSLAEPTQVEKTRSGFVARLNADASEVKIVTRGLRNPYGLDFNEHGELFTYDADAEYDMGASWYRPTRALHLVPGGDYGWRRVTQQWPPYFPDRADMPQPMLDIGKGSPTAVAFGTNSHFPPRYRSALYILDWAYGRIVAVHLAPRGASYQASAETFLRGQPLNVTDIEFGADGAMYFVTGGRATQSALYRVKYTGPAITPPPPSVQEKASESHAQESRATRRDLEQLLEKSPESKLPAIWSNLGSDDPWIRHTARAALEKAPASIWRKRALDESDLDKTLAARVALARSADEATWIGGRMKEANQRQKLELLYVAERVLASSPSDPAQAQTILAELRSVYPADNPIVNQELSRILSLHPDDAFVAQTLALLEKTASQTERLHYLFVLRNVIPGWTTESRNAYFELLRLMDDYVGGEGLPTFRKLIRQEAVAALPESQRPRFEKLLAASTVGWSGELPPARTALVRKWTVDELAAAWAESKVEHNPNRGKELFAVARCIVCHRAAGTGGVSGPDLTSVARRFAPRDILMSIVEPSKAIDEKYAAQALELADGRVITGRIAPGDYRAPDLEIIPNLLEPQKTIKFPKVDVVSRVASPTSPMPAGLVDTLTQDEILDLVAYLVAGPVRP